MNEQPQYWVGAFFAIIVFIVFLYHASQTFFNGPHINYLEKDLFKLGYFDGSDVNIVINKEPKPSYDMQLYKDCIDALYAIGVKKSQAKIRAKQVFESHNPSSVQEFLSLALKP
jgi:hypothetical protein